MPVVVFLGMYYFFFFPFVDPQLRLVYDIVQVVQVRPRYSMCKQGEKGKQRPVCGQMRAGWAVSSSQGYQAASPGRARVAGLPALGPRLQILSTP